MITSIKRFLREEDGITALEYGVLGAIVAVAIVLSKDTITDFFEGIFSTLKTSVDNAAEGT